MEHSANYQHLPPEMINDQEEYKVEQVINHQYHGCKKALQYLIHWKGYSAADDTWEPADQVFADALVKAYHIKHPLEGRGAPTFTTCLYAALAKSHWHPHSPLTNSGVTGPATKQDCIGAWKTFAPMVPTTSGTMKNMSILTHCAVTQPIKTTTVADASEKSMLKKSIHKALVKFFSCLPHTPPLHLPQGKEQWCNAACHRMLQGCQQLQHQLQPMGNLHSWQGMHCHHQKYSPLLPQPVWPCQGHSLPWCQWLVTFLSHGKHQKSCPTDGASPCSHHQLWCNFQPSERVISWCSWHTCQRNVCRPNDGVRQTSGG